MKQLFLLLSALLIATISFAQVNISGKILDKVSQDPLAGVNIKLKHKLVGTVSNPNGEFNFKTKENLPFEIEISMIGYKTQAIKIESNNSNLAINMVEEIYFGEEIIVSASRVQENILQSSVTVEKMDIREINATGAPNFYDAIANIKGIDMNTHSLLFKLPNSRGFNGETNYRFNQLIDGIDNAPPGLSFAAGNINGLSQLDVESVELIMGASSALYGPGGMNGTMLITSKNPFEYPGLSASIQTGLLNIGSEATGATPMVDVNLRYAKSFNDKFAFKIVASYLKAQDWAATDYRNRLDMDDTNLDHYTNPGYDGVNVYGDDVIVPVNLQDHAQSIAEGVAEQQGFLPGTPEYDNAVAQVINRVPDQLVTRTGFKEADIHDYDTYNFRSRLSLNYRINPDLELELQGGYTIGTSIYTAQTRYSLNNFQAYNSKLELKSPDFFIRAWAVKENAGNTFDVGGTALKFNEEWKPSAKWYEDFVSQFTVAYLFPGGNPLNTSYLLARQFADNRDQNGIIQNPLLPARPIPGTSEFNQIWNELIEKPISEGGGQVVDHSAMYHFEGMYDFSKFFNKTSLQVGASNRIYSLNSDGTIFFDKPGEPIMQNQFGAFGQLTQPFYRERLKVTISGRYDKNSNFDGQFTPRMSLVYSLDRDKNHNIRASTQTAFRFPATADQWLNLSLGQMNIDGKQFNFRVIGGNEEVHEFYNINNQNVYALSGNNPFIGVPESEPYQVPVFRPETVTALEIGYKGLYFNKLLYLDTYFFHNTYNSFHAKQALAQNPGTANENRYITTISAENPVITYGWAVGADMKMPGGFLLKGNLMNNSIDLGDNQTSGFQSRFNTPAYKINISLVNYHILKNLGFSVSWRWQDSFNWESDFGKTNIPSYNTLDAQVSMKLPQLSSVVKVGGSNLLNQYYATGLGNSTIGGLYYVSVTFDEFLN
jgi:iron complex outermembrane receptor protein